MVKNILLIPHIKIHNANALSSPYTIGFPAMTAWLGAIHALERKLKETNFDNVLFLSMGVVCHAIDLQTHKGSGEYVYSIIGTGNPLIPKTKNGDPQNAERPSFVEEARCHLTVSLVIEYDYPGLSLDDFTETIDHLLRGNMKMASGDIINVSSSKLFEIHNEASQKKLLQRLMPGHCLLERRDLMKKVMTNGKDAIDAMLDYLKVTHRCEIDEKNKVKWTSSCKEKGWLVPIATGFHGISPLGIAKNQRDPDTKHRFAESVVTLGEFVMPYRIEDLDNMLWHYHTDLENNLYLCRQNKPVTEN